MYVGWEVPPHHFPRKRILGLLPAPRFPGEVKILSITAIYPAFYSYKINMSSRTPMLDQCLAMRNLLALNDHQLERLVNLDQEYVEATDLPGLSYEEFSSISESYNSDIQHALDSYTQTYNLRKSLQSDFFKKYNIDLTHRCEFKHSLTIHEALKEIYDATKDPNDYQRYINFTHNFYLRLGKITGL